MNITELLVPWISSLSNCEKSCRTWALTPSRLPPSMPWATGGAGAWKARGVPVLCSQATRLTPGLLIAWVQLTEMDRNKTFHG